MSEGEEKEKGTKYVFKEILVKLPKIVSKYNCTCLRSSTNPKIATMRSTSRHIIKLLQPKWMKIFKGTRDKWQETSDMIKADFSSETMKFQGSGLTYSKYWKQ